MGEVDERWERDRKYQNEIKEGFFLRNEETTTKTTDELVEKFLYFPMKINWIFYIKYFFSRRSRSEQSSEKKNKEETNEPRNRCV